MLLTFGATLGVAAQTGNFRSGLGINYTGSSNIGEFGVQANTRTVIPIQGNKGR